MKKLLTLVLALALVLTSVAALAEWPERAIEFIGDSITCGYGVDDEVAEHHFATGTEDTTRAYALRTARKLGVDYSLVSLSHINFG